MSLRPVRSASLPHRGETKAEMAKVMANISPDHIFTSEGEAPSSRTKYTGKKGMSRVYEEDMRRAKKTKSPRQSFQFIAITSKKNPSTTGLSNLLESLI